MSDTTEDALLGGRVRLIQPAEGYRVAIDPVLLAAAIPAGPGERVLDLGSGTGAAALCLAVREPGCRVSGLERDLALVRLAQDSAHLTGVAARVDFMVGDLLAPPPRLAPGSFHHAMANPPYLPAAGAPSPQAGRAAAHVEGEAGLEEWVRAALTMVRPKGTVTFIHRADRLDQLIAAFASRAGELVLFPLWPDSGKPAKRILVRARKAVSAPARLAPGLVLHAPGGGFTEAAEAVLRGGAGLIL
ncbi:MAG TPA: methyltransferase [Alphaproteobacteria bacterium]|nr:methyltransferase [Alphaproteobacteria bacterium]